MTPCLRWSGVSALAVVIAGVLASSCGGPQAAKPPSAVDETPTVQPGEPPAGDADAGASLTSAQCEDAGGEVVGDIGDGAIHRPDYRCPGSGERPLARIGAAPGEPMAIEGAVCCRRASTP